MRPNSITKSVRYKGHHYKAELIANRGITGGGKPDEITGYYVKINSHCTGPELILGSYEEQNIYNAKEAIRQGIETYINLQEDFLKDWDGNLG